MLHKRTFGLFLLFFTGVAIDGCSPTQTAADGAAQASAPSALWDEIQAAENARHAAEVQASLAELAALEAESHASAERLEAERLQFEAEHQQAAIEAQARADAAAAALAEQQAELQAQLDAYAAAQAAAQAQNEADARAYADRLNAAADAKAAAGDVAGANALMAQAWARMQCLTTTNRDFDIFYGAAIGYRNNGYSAAVARSHVPSGSCGEAIIRAVFGP